MFIISCTLMLCLVLGKFEGKCKGKNREEKWKERKSGGK